MNSKKILNFTKKKYIKKKSNIILKSNKSTKKKIINKKDQKYKTFFKLKKKWRFWRLFKRIFLSTKKITFFEKLNSRFNTIRIIYHQLNKLYSCKIKNIISKQLKIQKNIKNFFFFFKSFELKLSTLLLRSRFFYKIINCINAVKLKLITINGIIINNTKFLVNTKDIVQKRRKKKQKKTSWSNRVKRLKWRNFRWKKARFLFWKIRRQSHFNLFWTKKQNVFLNYLEINYKIPAFIVLKHPNINEIIILKQPKLLTTLLLKKIYFLY